jgi:hypothetical protein
MGGGKMAISADQPVIRAARQLALTRLEASLGLIDHIDPALAPHDAVVAMAATQGFQRVTDFHDALYRLSVAGS